MIKIFSNIIVILSVFLFAGLQAHAENWVSTHNKMGNIIYVDTDSIRQQDNKIFYVVKYFEEKLGTANKVIIMSENKVPFAIGDSIAFTNYFFKTNLKNVNEKVLNYAETHTIKEIEPGSFYESLALNQEPYANGVIESIRKNLKYKFKYRNSSAKAMVKVNRNGEVKKVYIYESSGNADLNLALTNAIEKAAPFEPLPEKYDKTYAIFWIEVSYGKHKSLIVLNSIIAAGKLILK